MILSTGCHLPSFQVAWYKIGKDFTNISLNVTNEELRINNADKNDAGGYFFEYLDKKDKRVFTSKLESLFVLEKCKLKIKGFIELKSLAEIISDHTSSLRHECVTKKTFELKICLQC